MLFGLCWRLLALLLKSGDPRLHFRFGAILAVNSSMPSIKFARRLRNSAQILLKYAKFVAYNVKLNKSGVASRLLHSSSRVGGGGGGGGIKPRTLSLTRLCTADCSRTACFMRHFVPCIPSS